jgi:hypothetical protein
MDERMQIYRDALRAEGYPADAMTDEEIRRLSTSNFKVNQSLIRAESGASPRANRPGACCRIPPEGRP